MYGKGLKTGLGVGINEWEEIEERHCEWEEIGGWIDIGKRFYKRFLDGKGLKTKGDWLAGLVSGRRLRRGIVNGRRLEAGIVIWRLDERFEMGGYWGMDFWVGWNWNGALELDEIKEWGD